MSRMVDIVMIRTLGPRDIERFAGNSRVPVINGLTTEYHPCQMLADIYTYFEQRGPIARQDGRVGRRRATNAATRGSRRREILGFKLSLSHARGYEVDAARAACRGPRSTRNSPNPNEAVRGADLVTTDVWTSMGFEAENDARRRPSPGGTVDAR